MPTTTNSDHPLDAFCRCHKCHDAKVRRVDAFALGVWAGLNARETVVEGPGHTGTTYLPSASFSAVLAAFSEVEIGKTRRPPKMAAKTAG